MKRVMAAVYGLACYVIFLGTFLYAIGFVENLVVPKSVDSGTTGPMGTALLVNGLLLGLSPSSTAGWRARALRRGGHGLFLARSNAAPTCCLLAFHCSCCIGSGGPCRM